MLYTINDLYVGMRIQAQMGSWYTITQLLENDKGRIKAEVGNNDSFLYRPSWIVANLNSKTMKSDKSPTSTYQIY